MTIWLDPPKSICDDCKNITCVFQKGTYRAECEYLITDTNDVDWKAEKEKMDVIAELMLYETLKDMAEE